MGVAMTDIVQRLRKPRAGYYTETMCAAAAEIERLRALLLEAWNLPEDSPYAELVAMQARVLAAARATNEAAVVP